MVRDGSGLNYICEIVQEVYRLAGWYLYSQSDRLVSHGCPGGDTLDIGAS